MCRFSVSVSLFISNFIPDVLPELELNISTGLRQNFSLNSLDVSGCSSGVQGVSKKTESKVQS